MFGSTFRRLLPTSYAKYVAFARHQQVKRLEKLLSSEIPPQPPHDEERAFRDLQRRTYPRPADYSFDKFNSYQRAAKRLSDLGQRLPDLRNPARILEVSCGDGILGQLLSLAGHSVTLTDIEDWRMAGSGGLPFLVSDVCKSLPFDDASFDWVISFNATEHWNDPGAAVDELARVLRPGGAAYLNFGPLFNSPWGLHAWSFNFPYPQFLFSDAFIAAKLRLLPVHDLARTSHALQPTNKWHLKKYRQLWKRCPLTVEFLFEDQDYRYLDLIEEFGRCFAGRGLTVEEVTRNSIEILLRKSGAHGTVAEG